MEKNSASANHFAFFKTKPKARKMADDAMISIAGSQNLGERFSLTADQAAFGLNDFSIKETLIGDKCPTGGPCESYHPYRSADGSCNNLENPLWGAANTAFQRTLLPQYSDGCGDQGCPRVGQHCPVPGWSASTLSLMWTLPLSWTPTMSCSGDSLWTMTLLTHPCSVSPTPMRLVFNAAILMAVHQSASLSSILNASPLKSQKMTPSSASMVRDV